MDKRVYFPVGEEASTELLKHFDWKDMQHRVLNDPHFAGCSADFNWHAHIELRFNDKQLEKEVSNVLDQFSKTPEGQQTIRQAAAMQNYRIRTGQTKYATDQEGPLYITDKVLTVQSGFVSTINAVLISKVELEMNSMLSSDGTYRHTSLAGALYHELCHAKDGFDTLTQQKRYYNEVKGSEFERDLASIAQAGPNKEVESAIIEKESSIKEYPAILETNAFMQKYFGEVPRALSHNTNREITWLNETLHRTVPQPNLPEGIDYNAVPNLSVPNCKPAPTKTK